MPEVMSRKPWSLRALLRLVRAGSSRIGGSGPRPPRLPFRGSRSATPFPFGTLASGSTHHRTWSAWLFGRNLEVDRGTRRGWRDQRDHVRRALVDRVHVLVDLEHEGFRAHPAEEAARVHDAAAGRRLPRAALDPRRAL